MTDDAATSPEVHHGQAEVHHGQVSGGRRQWLVTGRRILLIVSPFLAIVVLLSTLAVVSIDILAAARAYVEGESLWSKNQKQAVFHLLRFAESGADVDFQRYREAIRVPMGFRQARLEMEKPDMDQAAVAAGLLQGGTHPEDIPGVVRLYRRFHDLSYMARVREIWSTGDDLLMKLHAAADELYAASKVTPPDEFRRRLILLRITAVNDELTPWQTLFSNTLGEATRWIQSVLLVVFLVVAGTLVPLGILLTQRMVSRVHRAERELEELKLVELYAEKLAYHARHDALTSLLNRPEFENRLRLALQTRAVHRRQHAVMYLDLDQFKLVNDTGGHAAGDQLLRQVAVLLKRQVREGDAVGRLGGDEFGVLLENCPLQDALVIAEQLRRCLAEFRFVHDDRCFTIGASIGVIQMSESMRSVTDVLCAADAACYLAKEKGRNRVQVYLPRRGELSLRRGEMEWISRIQRAIEEGRFVLYAQAIVGIREGTRRHGHHELLVRMLDERGCPVAPLTFIPAAERYGLIQSIDRWVIEQAFARIAALAAGSGTYAINVSGPSIADERFREFVREQLRRYDLGHGRICFEITETTAVTSLDEAARFVREMKTLGCLFSLDDFGAGVSSFGYLKHLPVDFIKIDGSFIQELAHSPVDRAMVRAINDLGHVMGKQTIGEWVDDVTGLMRLRELGVDFAQGNWLAPPAPFPLSAPGCPADPDAGGRECPSRMVRAW